MNNTNITTPCISVCKSDPMTDYCYGCGRTSEDKKMWSDPNTSNEWKQENLKILRNRLRASEARLSRISYEHLMKTS